MSVLRRSAGRSAQLSSDRIKGPHAITLRSQRNRIASSDEQTITNPQLVSTPDIAQRIFTVRGQKVIISIHLAELYKVEPRSLIQAVQRNRSRFPSDFVFQLTAQEFTNLKSQFVISSSSKHGGARALPYAFTEHGALMAANVLKSKRAAQISVEIVRAFVHLRRFALTNRDLARKIADLESRYDGQFEQIFDALRALLASPEPSHNRKMGFQQSRE